MRNVWDILDIKPTLSEIHAYMKDRSAYQPWKVLDVRFYVTTFRVRDIWREGTRYVPSVDETLYKLTSMSYRPIACLVEWNGYLIGLRKDRGLSEFATGICPDCFWIKPGHHSPECSLGAVEEVCDE
jgi:hypothetical protein